MHDPGRSDPGLAFSLARLADDPTVPTPIGIFRQVERHVYGRGGPDRDDARHRRRAVGPAARRRQLDRRLAAGTATLWNSPSALATLDM